MGKKLAYDDVKYFIEVESNSGCKLISEEYINVDSKLKLKCRCDELFEVSFDKFRGRNKRTCNICGWDKMALDRKMKFNKVSELFEVLGGKLLSTEKEYKNNTTPMKFECMKHTGTVHQVAYSQAKIGKSLSCPDCVTENLRSKFQLKNPFVEFIQNNLIPQIPEKEYINTNQKIPFLCKFHLSKEVQFVTLAHLKRGQGCIYCSSKMSKPEKRVDKYLESIGNLDYKYQHKFIDTEIFKLSFDFQINMGYDNQLLIEYDGQQHFQAVRFNNMSKPVSETSFKEGIVRDKIKNQYCIDNNIPLIRIPYWKFDSIEIILESALMHYNIIPKTDSYDYSLIGAWIVDYGWNHGEYIANSQ